MLRCWGEVHEASPGEIKMRNKESQHAEVQILNEKFYI